MLSNRRIDRLERRRCVRRARRVAFAAARFAVRCTRHPHNAFMRVPIACLLFVFHGGVQRVLPAMSRHAHHSACPSERWRCSQATDAPRGIGRAAVDMAEGQAVEYDRQTCRLPRCPPKSPVGAAAVVYRAAQCCSVAGQNQRPLSPLTAFCSRHVYPAER